MGAFFKLAAGSEALMSCVVEFAVAALGVSLAWMNPEILRGLLACGVSVVVFVHPGTVCFP